MKITVIGCGRWGSLITWYLDRMGHDVTLYGMANSPEMQRFLATRQNDLLSLPESVHLTERVKEIEDGLCAQAMETIMGKSIEELKELYNNRDIEK